VLNSKKVAILKEEKEKLKNKKTEINMNTKRATLGPQTLNLMFQVKEYRYI